jgi:hypothetical protein
LLRSPKVASTRDIRTNQVDISCDVCGRTLLRGERAEAYLAGGERRQVCELCTVRAFFDKFRARRERAREVADAAEAEAGAAPPAPEGREPQHEPPPDLPRRPRHVRAVPTNAELKVERALEVFNASEHTRTVGGIARSLGAPEVSARPLADRPSVVGIAVMWELSWYRFEIDLSDEAGGVRQVAQGAELSELDPEELVGNAAADERGLLHLPVAE